MFIYVIALIAFIVGVAISLNRGGSSPNVFVAYADDGVDDREDNYSGFVIIADNIQSDEYKVLINGCGLESAGLISGKYYKFKKLICENNKKLDYISVGNVVLLDFPEIRLRQVFEVVGINYDDGLLTLAWYNDDDNKKKVFNYYTNPIIGIMK